MISIIVPFYINKNIPEISFFCYNNLGKKLEVILIDDASPTRINYKEYQFIKFLRIDKDIEWNQPAASNLGVSESSHELIIHSNIDCLLFQPTIDFLKENPPNKGEVIKFKRLYRGNEIDPHPNVYCMNRADYWPGYDESFCGSYGNDDKHFFASKRLKKVVIDQYILSLDLNCHNLKRNRKANDEKLNQKINGYKS
jgi:hypothetical protein